MNSAARPRNDTTKLRALATGLRLMTTAAPKISVSKAKIQNKNGDISLISNSNSAVHFFLFHFNTTPCMTRRVLYYPERSEGSRNRSLHQRGTKNGSGRWR